MSYGSSNQKAYSSGNQAAYGSGNQAAYGSGNQAAYGSGNQAAYGSGNQAAYGSGNQAAYGSGNQAAAWSPSGNGTGAGQPSGSGFLGGYGPVARSDYATPADLGPVPWALDFSRGNGWPAFPMAVRLNPFDFEPPLEFGTGDWDPGLRFWTLGFDPQLTEWLQDLDLSRPAVMAAREFATQHAVWAAKDVPDAQGLQRLLDPTAHLGWRKHDSGGAFIAAELVELEDLMIDDRARYLQEAELQSRSIPTYFMHLMGIDSQSKPWTVELINCASAIANLVKMQYKAHYRRVRPSFLCPGLVPPWGPPQHPAFPSGHSLVAHLTALFLLEIPGVQPRFGLVRSEAGMGGAPTLADFIGPRSTRWGHDQRCALLWLAWRVARNRERLGLHYPSDSRASRRLAVGVWAACFGRDEASRKFSHDTDQGAAITLPAILVPTLHAVLAKAQAEWPDRPRPSGA